MMDQTKVLRRGDLVSEVVQAAKRWWTSVRSKAQHGRMGTTELRLWQAARALDEHDEATSSVSDDELRELYGQHCECRPLNTARISHSHDCCCGILDDVRMALHGFALDRDADGKEYDWPVSVTDEERHAARLRCAEVVAQARAK